LFDGGTTLSEIMRTVALLAVAAVVIMFMAWLAYAAWFLRRIAGNGFPRCQLVVEPAGPGVTIVSVTLVGSTLRYRLERFTCDATPGSEPSIHMPHGFEIERDHGLDEGTMSWVPGRPIEFRPDAPVQFEFRYDATVHEPVRVSGWLEARVGAGGSGTTFGVPVGPMSDEQRDLFNLGSRVRSESVARGIVPRDHPDWARLQAAEAQQRAGGR
jgi:hypothetical protein